MKWITREKPKIDRIACPWLIKNFIDKKAEFIFVHSDSVKKLATKLEAIPFDIPGVEYTHYEDQCTFDYFIQKHKIKDPAILKMATIIRAADTDRHHLAQESSGLWAISAGLSFLFKEDQELLQKGMMIYDALYAWAKYLQNEQHSNNPIESILLDVYQKYLKDQVDKRKRGLGVPKWVTELQNLIQDQIDTNLNINLTKASQTVELHPAYLSREFSKYFNNQTFGEYLRSLRIEKAILLLIKTRHSISEVAYLTGFSDQSHFSRIFRKHTGISPLNYRRKHQKRTRE